MAFQVTAYSNTSFSLPSSCSGSVPRSPQLMVKRGHFCLSATHSVADQLDLRPFRGKTEIFIGLTSGKRFARARRAMEQDREAAPLAAHYITKARFFQSIRFHHSLNDPFIIISNDQSSERFLSELDRLEVIHLY